MLNPRTLHNAQPDTALPTLFSIHLYLSPEEVLPSPLTLARCCP
ncbi:TPA: hypothetical protein ACPZAA_001605 [Yersinia enterocolitica]